MIYYGNCGDEDITWWCDLHVFLADWINYNKVKQSKYFNVGDLKYG